MENNLVEEEECLALTEIPPMCDNELEDDPIADNIQTKKVPHYYKEIYSSFSPKNIVLENPAQEEKYNATEIKLIYDEIISKYTKLTCCYCEKPMEDFIDLSRHCTVVHKKTPLVQCCGKKLFKRITLYDHVAKHHMNPDYFKCDQCGKVLSNRYGLKIHMINHNAIREHNVSCEVCSKMVSQESYKRHMLSHAPEKDRNFKCSQCNKR